MPGKTATSFSFLSCFKQLSAGFTVVIIAAALSGCGGGSSSPTPTPTPTPTPSQDPDSRADAMLAKMSQADKLQMVQGGATAASPTAPLGVAGWVPGNAALSIPALYLADGSVGAGNGIGPAT